MSKITGNTGAFQQPYEVHKNESGVRTVVPYESTDPNQILAWQLSASLAGLPYDVKFSYGKGHIDVHYPYDFTKDPKTEVINLWELFAQKVEKDVLDADLSNGGIGQISAADAFLIKTALGYCESGIPVAASWFDTPVNPTDLVDSEGSPDPNRTPGALTDASGQPVAPAANPSGCYSVLCLMLRGVRSHPVLAPCLRHTQTANSQYAIQASLTNVSKVLSTATLQSNEGVPSGLLFNLPTFSAPPQYVESAGDLQYGWYKDFPTVRQIAGMKWNIEQEWQYGLYSVKLYGYPL
jgi:hypothetical protein